MAKMDHDFIKALRHGDATGRRIGRGYRPAGDVVDQYHDDTRSYPLPAVAAGRIVYSPQNEHGLNTDRNAD